MLFCKSFVSPVNTNFIFELRPITIYNCQVAARLFAKNFKDEALCKYFGLSETQLFEYDSYPLALLNAEENLGVACYDINKDLMIGVLLHDDPARLQERFIHSIDSNVSKAYGFTDIYKKENQELFDSLKKSQEGWLHGCNFTIDNSYQKLGLGTIIQKFALEEHPVLRNYRYFTFDATSTFSVKIAKKMNFEEIWSKSWLDIAKHPGNEYYNNMIQYIRSVDNSFDDIYHLYLYDRKKINNRSSDVIRS